MNASEMSQLCEVDAAIQRVTSVIGPKFGVGDVVGFPEIIHLLSLLVQLMIPLLASDGKSFEEKIPKTGAIDRYFVVSLRM